MNNNHGSTMIVALLVLCLLTISGVAAMRTSITESHISTNTVIHEMEFYAAESGTVHGSMWLLSQNLKDDINTDEFGPDEDWFTFSNKTKYIWSAKHQQNSGGIMYYGDEDGDHMWEINNTTGYPIEIIIGTGIHPRGGVVMIETRWQFEQAFEMPLAAMWVHSNVNGNGASGSIVGEGPSDPSLMDKDFYDSDYSCAPVADIMYQTSLPNIDYSGNTGYDAANYQQSTGYYPLILMLPNLKRMANAVITQADISGNKLPDGAPLNDTVLYISGDTVINDNITGSGILVIDGSFTCGGNFNWDGLVLVNGNATFNGGGSSKSTTIHGSIVAIGDAIAINGSVNIIYDCNILNNLYSNHARYHMLTWRQL